MALNITGGALEFDAIINASQFGAQIADMEARLKGLTSVANDQTRSVENFAQKASLAIATYVSATTVSNFITDVVRVRGQFQQLEVAFETMLGSREKAQQLMAEVTDFAAKTPFELTEVAGATKQLLAFGIGADKVKETLTRLGDIASGLGQPLSEIAYLYGTIKTAGVANSVDIKQFAQRGIPIYEALADVLKVDVKQVTALVSAGKVGFPEIEKAFQSMTSEGSKFGGLMAAQAKTLGGLTSNFRDAYDQMLNDIGKSSEGLFASTIKGATVVVENYQKVLDVIKVLAATYGTYKAAVIATNVVNSISIGLTQGYTLAETLRYRAMLISEAAMKLLNRTMLLNPYVAVATGVAAIVSAFIIFRKETTQVKSAQELLSKAQENFAGKLADTEAKIRPYVDALKNANISEQDRLNIYNKLKAIDPDIVKGLDAKTLSYDALTKNVNLYLDALRKQIAFETNKEALGSSIKAEQLLQNKIDSATREINNINRILDLPENRGNDNQAIRDAKLRRDEFKNQIEQAKKDLEGQRKVSEQLGQSQVNTENKTQDAVKRTIKVIEDEIKALKDKQSENSTTSKEYQDFQKQIEAKEKELESIRGKSKSTIAGENKLETAINSLLSQRKDLLQSIDDLRRGAKQSGLVKEQSELDKINEKYDTAILKISEYNKKVADFNKKNNTKVSQVGTTDINALNAARTEELRNVRLKEDAENFAKSLEVRKGLYEQYEEAKKNIGIDKANQMFEGQLKGFKSYSEFLQDEFKKQVPKIVFGIANIGDIQKFKDLVKAISDETKKQTEQEIKDFADLLNQTVNFNDKKQAIDVKYNKFFETLKKNRLQMGEDEYDRRLVALQNSQDEEINALKISFAKQSDLYKKLGQDILLFTKDQLKARVKELKNTLDTDTSLTPQMKADVQAAINNLEGLMEATDETIVHLNKFIAGATKIKGALDDLGTAMEPLNAGISDSIKLMSSLLNATIGVASGLKDFKVAKGKDDLIGQITGVTSIVSAVTTAVGFVVNLFKRAKESKKEAQQQIDDFNDRILQGEITITQEYRNRQREQILLNKLKLDGLKAEKKLLEEQKNTVRDRYNDVLKQLQQQSAVVGETTKKTGGVLGIGRKTKVVEITQSLAGQTFDQLEELFTKGQLTGKAKELFETLQKLKQEGVDIDKQLEDLKRESQEIFTGTTSDSITDAIADGFKNGLHTAADFSGKFEDLMREAIINALKFKYLEGPVQELFASFADKAESGGTLTKEEIEDLRKKYNAIISNANKQFEQLQQIAGVNFSAQSGQQQNVLTGQFRQMSEDTGNELVGQFNGQRIATLQLLDVQKLALGNLNHIELNTANTVVELKNVAAKLDYYYSNVGVKLK